MKPLIGVNLAGGEFGANPGALGVDYVYPSMDQINYYADRGLTLIRIPVLSRRLTRPTGPYMPDISALMIAIDAASHRGMTVVLDLHEYGVKSDGTAISTSSADLSAFKRTWRILAAQFRSRTNVWFGLMNEPHLQTPADWIKIANAGISGIREVAPSATITVMGSQWGSATDFITSGNAAAMDGLVAPGPFIIEVHQYLDDGTGQPDKPYVPGAGSTRLVEVTNWARSREKRLFLGETGFTSEAGYMTEGRALLSYICANPDVWIAAAYWAGGLFWAQGRSTYAFSIEPANFSGAQDRPQMGVLTGLL